MRRVPSDPSITDLRLKDCGHDSETSLRVENLRKLEDNILVGEIHMLGIYFLSTCLPYRGSF